MPMNLSQHIQTVLKTFQVNPEHTPQQVVSAKLHYNIRSLERLGIKANYDPLASGKNRVLFYSSRYNSRNYKLASECNGVVFNYLDWTPMRTPPPLANGNFSHTVVSDNFNHYDVYPIQDGTVVNLSYDSGAWAIGTLKGIDLTGVSWCGITFGDALREAFTASGFSMDKLHTDRTYSFGFTHPKMHYCQTLQSWLIGASDPGSPHHTFMFDTLDPELAGLPQQQTTDEFKSFADVQTRCAAPFSAPDKTPFWGVILRSRRPEVTRESSTVLIESDFMVNVRRMVYDQDISVQATALGISRDQYLRMSALVEPARFALSKQLWPDRAAALEEDAQRITVLAALVEAAPQPGEAISVSVLRKNIQSLKAPVNTIDYIRQRANISILHSYFASFPVPLIQ